MFDLLTPLVSGPLLSSIGQNGGNVQMIPAASVVLSEREQPIFDSACK
jgi:hypothetical protein